MMLIVMFAASAWAAEKPEAARAPARFPLTEEQVMGPRFLDCLREAVEHWSLSLYDPTTGGFGSLAVTSDVIWSRYAVNAKDPGAPDRERIIAFINDQIGSGHNHGHRFWMAIRSLRILDGQPAKAPKAYAALQTAASFGAHARAIIEGRSGGGHHSILGLLPLVVSSGDPLVSLCA
jgi:predicted Rdx family selenoprotein